METKHPLMSNGMRAAYITIIVGILQYFGIVGPQDKVAVTIDTMDAPPEKSVVEEATPLTLIGAGLLAIKGRKEANSAIGPWRKKKKGAAK